MLDSELRIVSANRAFYSAFRTTPKLEVGELFQEVSAGRWDDSQLTARLRAALSEPEGLRGYRVQADGSYAGPEHYLLAARPLNVQGSAKMLLVTITEDTRTEPAQT